VDGQEQRQVGRHAERKAGKQSCSKCRNKGRQVVIAAVNTAKQLACGNEDRQVWGKKAGKIGVQQ
jgi:hypothetical protein